MAFDPQSSEQPEFVVVSEYSVERLGVYPKVRILYEECVYLTRTLRPVTASFDRDADQLIEILEVPSIASADGETVAGLAGAKLLDPAGDLVGTILGAQEIVTMDGEVEISRTVEVTLVEGITAVPFEVAVVERMPTGADTYRRAQRGQRWEHILDGAVPPHMAQINSMLGTAYFVAAKAILTQLGLVATDADIATAVQALAAQGTHLDGILAQQAEALEQLRVAGNAPWLTTYGNAP